jgi:hypothetical protein
MAVGSTQPATEMSTRNLPGGKGREAHIPDNLTAFSQLSRKCVNLDVSQPYGSPEPVTGITLPFCIPLQLIIETDKDMSFQSVVTCGLLDRFLRHDNSL